MHSFHSAHCWVCWGKFPRLNCRILGHIDRFLGRRLRGTRNSSVCRAATELIKFRIACYRWTQQMNLDCLSVCYKRLRNIWGYIHTFRYCDCSMYTLAKTTIVQFCIDFDQLIVSDSIYSFVGRTFFVFIVSGRHYLIKSGPRAFYSCQSLSGLIIRSVLLLLIGCKIMHCLFAISYLLEVRVE